MQRAQPGRSPREIDISGPWGVVAVHAAVSAATGTRLDASTNPELLREFCLQHDVHLTDGATAGQLVMNLYDALVEPTTELPTFYTKFPLETSPLTRAHRDDATLAERWDPVAFGTEIGTAYAELVDPVEQRRRFTEQSLAAATGDPEAGWCRSRLCARSAPTHRRRLARQVRTSNRGIPDPPIEPTQDPPAGFR